MQTTAILHVSFIGSKQKMSKIRKNKYKQDSEKESFFMCKNSLLFKFFLTYINKEK